MHELVAERAIKINHGILDDKKFEFGVYDKRKKMRDCSRLAPLKILSLA
jgi:hypothetical protein